MRTARLGVDAAALDRTVAASALRLQVVQAYGRALAATARRRSEVAALETVQENVRRAEARRDAGVETEANVLAFRVHLSEVEARQARAAADEAVARAALNAVMGGAAGTVEAQGHRLDSFGPHGGYGIVRQHGRHGRGHGDGNAARRRATRHHRQVDGRR